MIEWTPCEACDKKLRRADPPQEPVYPQYRAAGPFDGMCQLCGCYFQDGDPIVEFELDRLMHDDCWTGGKKHKRVGMCELINRGAKFYTLNGTSCADLPTNSYCLDDVLPGDVEPMYRKIY